MSLTPQPKTERAWEIACLRLLVIAGLILLSVQVWARLMLSGPTRQHIEETLWPFPFFLGFILICCSVVAVFQRHRLLGLLAALVGILSSVIGLLPILLQEAIYD